MAFGSLCCGICAWFSVIGVAFYAIIALMLLRENRPLIEHKFKISPNHAGEYPDVVEDRFFTMALMAVIMVFASVGCFALSFIL